jgi:hypothetical protein
MVDSMIESAIFIRKIATKNISENDVTYTLEILNKVSQNISVYLNSVCPTKKA